jgi:hypothetical protein
MNLGVWKHVWEKIQTENNAATSGDSFNVLSKRDIPLTAMPKRLV